jgi:hypothetical protein
MNLHDVPDEALIEELSHRGACLTMVLMTVEQGAVFGHVALSGTPELQLLGAWELLGKVLEREPAAAAGSKQQALMDAINEISSMLKEVADSRRTGYLPGENN